MFLWPVMTLFTAGAVCATFLGKVVRWETQARDDRQVSWPRRSASRWMRWWLAPRCSSASPGRGTSGSACGSLPWRWRSSPARPRASGPALRPRPRGAGAGPVPDGGRHRPGAGTRGARTDPRHPRRPARTAPREPAVWIPAADECGSLSSSMMARAARSRPPYRIRPISTPRIVRNRIDACRGIRASGFWPRVAPGSALREIAKHQTGCFELADIGGGPFRAGMLRDVA